MNLHTLRLSVCHAALLLILAGSAPSAAEVYEAPVDPRDRMSELDDAILAKQRELFAARQHGDMAAIDKLTKEFDDIQRQRRELLQRDPRLN